MIKVSFKFSNSIKQELKKSFDKYDKAKSGCIKPEDLGDVFRMSGQNPTVIEANKMVAEAQQFVAG